jgi:hypothetical protein
LFSDDEDANEPMQQTGGQAVGDLLDLDFGAPVATSPAPPVPASTGGQNALLDLLGDLPASVAPKSPIAIGLPTGLETLVSPTSATPKQVVLPAEQGKGLEVSLRFGRKAGTTHMYLTLNNKSMAPLSDFAIQFNKNRYFHSYLIFLPALLPFVYHMMIHVVLVLFQHNHWLWLIPCHQAKPKTWMSHLRLRDRSKKPNLCIFFKSHSRTMLVYSTFKPL